MTANARALRGATDRSEDGHRARPPTPALAGDGGIVRRVHVCAPGVLASVYAMNVLGRTPGDPAGRETQERRTRAHLARPGVDSGPDAAARIDVRLLHDVGAPAALRGTTARWEVEAVATPTSAKRALATLGLAGASSRMDHEAPRPVDAPWPGRTAAAPGAAGRDA